MSYVFTGTATNHADLLDKVIGHLTGTGMGTEAWTQLALDSTSVPGERFAYLKAPGLAGTDNIYINIRQYANVGSDIYNWHVRGAVNYSNAAGYIFSNQPGTSPSGTVPLWNSSIPYWLIANGRRFILIAKVSTTYQSVYAGLYLPYATSSEMPYPMAIMCSASGEQRWSAGNYTVSGFWDPIDASSYVRHWDGNWVRISNMQYRTDGNRYGLTDSNSWPWELDYKIGQNQDLSYGLLPCILHSNYSSGNVYGELEGVFFVSGFSNAAEDTITIGADTYLVVQSVYRTGRLDYSAIKLG